jgi:hypothetical protein
MNQMEERKDFFIMHQAVRPVKISVMKEEHNWESKEKIKPSMLMDVSIISCMRRDGRIFQNQYGHCSKNENGNSRINNFPGIIFQPGIPGLNFFMENPAMKNNIENKESQAGNEKISATDYSKRFPIFYPMHKKKVLQVKLPAGPIK